MSIDLYKKTPSKQEVINRLNHLRGLYSILIVIGHTSMNYEKELLPLLIIHKFNFVGVCFFFMISGCCLAINSNDRHNYLSGYIKKKPIKLMLLALTCEIVSRIIKYLILGVLCIDINIILGWNWYIYEALFFYIVFYVTFKVAKKKWLKCVLISLAAIGISSVQFYRVEILHSSLFANHAWYFSAWSFAFGVTLGLYYDKIMSCVIRNIYAYSVFCVLVSIACCFLTLLPKDSYLGAVVLHNILGISLMMIIVIWANYFDYSKLPLSWLSKYSAEIYLYQFVVIEIILATYLLAGNTVDIKYSIAVVGGTCMLSCCMNRIDNKLVKLVINCAK